MIEVYGVAGLITFCMLLALAFALGIGAGITIVFHHVNDLTGGSKRAK